MRGSEYDGAVRVAPRRRGGVTPSRVGDAARVALAAIRIFNGAVALLAPAFAAKRVGARGARTTRGGSSASAP